MGRDWVRTPVAVRLDLTATGRSARSVLPNGGNMIISETTIATSVTADADMSLDEIANQAAILLVLGATDTLAQAILTSEVLGEGVARATVRGFGPEPASVSITMTTSGFEALGPTGKRVLMSATIAVSTGTVACSQALTNALVASVPNRLIKPIVVVRSPVSEQLMMQTDGSAWREIVTWRHDEV
jgi:hypothetical protein